MDTTIDDDAALSGAGSTPRPRVVVGVDGSSGSRVALEFALRAAARRGAGLDVVAGCAIELYYVGGVPLDVPDFAGLRADLHDRVSALVEEVRAEPAMASVPGVEDVPIRVVVTEEPTVLALVDRAEGAELLVVGSRGRGAMRSALLGSVALHCVTHAPCPVAVVHPAPAGVVPSARIVVGVDGSSASRAALAAALDEADRTGAEVEAVATYVLADVWTDLSSVVVPSAEHVRDDVRRRTEQLVDEVLAGRPAQAGAAPVVRVEVLEGPAAEVLLARARDAALLVVGSTGRGALRGLLLGSVALHCAMHAPCPVLVVHPRRESPGAAGTPRAAAMADS